MLDGVKIRKIITCLLKKNIILQKKQMFKYLIKNYVVNSEKHKQKALLMLHGYGSNEADLFSFAGYLPEDWVIISARAPYSLSFGGYAWYDLFIDAQGNKISDNLQAQDSLKKLSQFIDYLKEKYQIDAANFNLMGFSQGAILSYALALNYPDKIKNVIALSGYINEDVMPLQEKIENYRHLNFFVSHGIYDEVISVKEARKIPPYLQARKIQHIYNEYNMGHEVNDECMEDMLSWTKQNF